MTSVIDVTKKWTFKNKINQNKIQWKKSSMNAIFFITPCYKTIPAKEDNNYKSFCWTQLLLYKLFCNLHIVIDSSPDEIVRVWEIYMTKY